MKNLLALLLLAFLPACKGAGFGQGHDLELANLYVTSASQTLADLETYASTHPGGADAASLRKVHAVLADISTDLQAAIAAGRTDLDVRDLLSAFNAASKPLLMSEDVRIAQLAIVLRGAINTFTLVIGGAPPPATN